MSHCQVSDHSGPTPEGQQCFRKSYIWRSGEWHFSNERRLVVCAVWEAYCQPLGFCEKNTDSYDKLMFLLGLGNNLLGLNGRNLLMLRLISTEEYPSPRSLCSTKRWSWEEMVENKQCGGSHYLAESSLDIGSLNEWMYNLMNEQNTNIVKKALNLKS